MLVNVNWVFDIAKLVVDCGNKDYIIETKFLKKFPNISNIDDIKRVIKV